MIGVHARAGATNIQTAILMGRVTIRDGRRVLPEERMRFTVHVALLFALTGLGPITAARGAEDVPFVTTPDNVAIAMLEAAKVNRRDYVIDLGSGDGRIVIVAAQRFGAQGLGVEIVPDLVRQSRENARRAGVEAKTEFREQDLFQTDLARATVITLYLLAEVNLQLRPSLLALRPGTRIVSHDWDMGDWKPDRTITLAVPDKKVGLEKSSRVHLWIVPARLDGEWCGTGAARGTRLTLRQQFQEVSGELSGGGSTKAFQGHIEGALVPTNARFELRLSRKRLVMSTSSGPFHSLRAMAFVQRRGAACAQSL
jgi:SAM-dependent methyltransferase